MLDSRMERKRELKKMMCYHNISLQGKNICFTTQNRAGLLKELEVFKVDPNKNLAENRTAYYQARAGLFLISGDYYYIKKIDTRTDGFSEVLLHQLNEKYLKK